MSPISTVLIIDHHRESSSGLSHILQQSGLLTRSVPNGRDALLELAREVPDAIVLDPALPEMSGTEFLRILRSYIRWAIVPVILVTPYPDAPDIADARQFGVRNVYRKGSYLVEDLVGCLTELVRNPNHHGQGGIDM